MKKLYVGNLPYHASEGDLESFFTSAGIAVEAINLMRDRFSGEPRGFGFVQVADSDMDKAIAACNGKDLLGRALVINEARPMRDAGGGGGRPGGGGRDRGGRDRR